MYADCRFHLSRWSHWLIFEEQLSRHLTTSTSRQPPDPPEASKKCSGTEAAGGWGVISPFSSTLLSGPPYKAQEYFTKATVVIPTIETQGPHRRGSWSIETAQPKTWQFGSEAFSAPGNRPHGKQNQALVKGGQWLRALGMMQLGAAIPRSLWLSISLVTVVGSLCMAYL